MPRLYTSDSDPLDFCRKHFPETEEEAFDLFGHMGDGPDGRGNCFGYDTGSPSYDDDENPYFCHACQRRLTDTTD